MRKSFAAFAVIISVVPGVLIMLVGIGPEPENWSTLVGTLVIAAGLLSLLVLFASRTRLEKRARAGAGKYATLLVILAVALLVIFFPLFRKSFVTHREHGTVFFPLWTTGQVKELTERTGGRYQLLDKYGNTSVAQLVRLMPHYEWAIVGTTALLLMLYQGAISALSSSFLLLGFDKARIQPEVAAVSPASAGKVIKILFLAANPADTDQLRLDVEVRTIDERLRLAEFRDRFDLRQQWAIRPADLQAHLLRHQPEIVHFSGHGSEASEIILQDDADLSHPVSAQALSDLFSVFKDSTRCVVLNACYSEPQAKAIAEHIQCVVGMSKAISDVAALSFAASFYQALGYGRDIKTAFQMGCGQINLQNLDEQDTPKLLTAKGIDPSELLLLERES